MRVGVIGTEEAVQMRMGILQGDLMCDFRTVAELKPETAQHAVSCQQAVHMTAASTNITKRQQTSDLGSLCVFGVVKSGADEPDRVIEQVCVGVCASKTRSTTVAYRLQRIVNSGLWRLKFQAVQIAVSDEGKERFHHLAAAQMVWPIPGECKEGPVVALGQHSRATELTTGRISVECKARSRNATDRPDEHFNPRQRITHIRPQQHQWPGATDWRQKSHVFRDHTVHVDCDITGIKIIVILIIVMKPAMGLLGDTFDHDDKNIFNLKLLESFLRLQM